MKYLSCRSSDYSRNNWVFNKISIPSPNAPLLTKWLALYSTGKSCGGTRTKVVWRWHCARCVKVWTGTKRWVVAVVSNFVFVLTWAFLALFFFLFLSPVVSWVGQEVGVLKECCFFWLFCDGLQSLALQPCNADPSVETLLSLSFSRSRAMGLLVLKKLTWDCDDNGSPKKAQIIN